jgi:hypothetical protein
LWIHVVSEKLKVESCPYPSHAYTLLDRRIALDRLRLHAEVFPGALEDRKITPEVFEKMLVGSLGMKGEGR